VVHNYGRRKGKSKLFKNVVIYKNLKSHFTNRQIYLLQVACSAWDRARSTHVPHDGNWLTRQFICIALHEKHAHVPRACFTINWIVFSIARDTNTYGIYKHFICPQEKTSDLGQALLPVYSHHLRYLKDVRAKNFYNTDFFHSLATVR